MTTTKTQNDIFAHYIVTISSAGMIVKTVEHFYALKSARNFAQDFARRIDPAHLTTYRIEVKYSDGDEGVVETGGYKNGKEFEY